MQKLLKLITLQGAIEKSPILLSQYWKNEWLDGNIHRILVVAIIFSPTVVSMPTYNTIFDYKITTVNSQYTNIKSKGYFVP